MSPSKLVAAHADIIGESAYVFEGYEAGHLPTYDGEDKIFEDRTIARSDPANERAVIHTEQRRPNWSWGASRNWSSWEVDLEDGYSEYIIHQTGYQTPDTRYTLAGSFESLHQSTLGRDEMLQQTFEVADSEATEVITEQGNTYIRFELIYPNRPVSEAYAIVRTDGLITEIHAPDTDTDALDESNNTDQRRMQDGLDGFHLELRSDMNLTNVTDSNEILQRYENSDSRPYPHRQHDRLLIETREYDSPESSTCGTNDGDQSYEEDNDRDNDGICDED